MKKIYFFKLVLCMLMYMSIHNLHAQKINLIDIDKYTNSWPRNNEYNAKNAYVLYKGYSYFTADDGIHGRELWRTNGTTAGTKLIKDVNPGTGSSDYDYTQYDLTVSGGKLFFAADGGSGVGAGLWVSDGTASGTQFIIDASGEGSLPTYLTDVNGTLFFALSYFDYINTFSYVNQIWKSDGTAAGTVLVADLGSNGYNLQQLKNVNGKLFFTFYNYYYYPSNQLYTSDGTSAGTYPVSSYNGTPLHLTSSNGLLYFIADDGTGSNVWISDGTTGGTHGVNSNGIYVYSTSDVFNTDTFAIINNVLYFQGSDNTGDNTLYKYDENNPAAGVTLVKDIIPGISSYPSFMTNVNGTLFFTIGPAGADAELWKSDGTDVGTVLVKDINPGGYNGYYGLTAAGNILLFALNTNNTGIELWKSDGTAGGTKIVKDIDPGLYWSIPQYLSYNNGLLLFGAFDGVNGYELWKSNGTTAGTTMIKDINKTSSSSSYPSGFTGTANNKIVFTATDEKNGRELWSTDGTAAGSTLVKDINNGTFDGNPAFLTKLKNKTYFFANDSTGYHLWKTNGTSSGTQVIKPTAIDTDPDFYTIQQMIGATDLIYIFLYDNNTGAQQLWRTDGTTTGTYVVKSDIPPYYLLSPIVIGNTLYFTSDDFTGTYGNELYKSEGTAATTGIVKDIAPGPGGSYPYDLFNFNGKLYFGANTGAPLYTNVLWTSDGTDAGTKIVKSLYVQQTYPSFAQANGKFFFYGENAVTKGYELYASDGTSAGTKLVKDIYKGANSSNVNLMVSGDTLIYFIANDVKHGTELWKSNGSSDGTSLVKDITPGSNGTFFSSNMINIHDKLYFTVNDTLWVSDGSKKGTNPINDPILEGVTNVSNLTNINGVLYFSATSPTAGNELYVLTPSNTSAAVEMVNNNTIISNADEFSAKLLTNPVTDQLKFTVNVKTQQQAKVLIMDMSGRILANDKQTLLPGTNTLSYNTSAWAKGIYMINIVTSEKFNATLRSLK